MSASICIMLSFDIQIVQIDNGDLNAWEGCLVELEEKFGIELSNKIMTA